MARRNGKQRFDPNAVHYVRKPFKAGGRFLQRGERYDAKRDMLSQRRVRQLYEANYLGQESASAPEPKPEPVMEPEPESAQDEGPAFDDMTKAELVELAKSEGIPYAAQKNKSELIELLNP